MRRGPTHAQNADQYLDQGGTNEVTAAQLKALVVSGVAVNVVSITTTPYAVTSDTFGSVFVIDRSDATVINLMAGAEGLIGRMSEFYKLGTGSLTINANGADTMGGASTLTNGTSETNASVGIRLVTSSKYGIKPGLGTWTES